MSLLSGLFSRRRAKVEVKVEGTPLADGWPRAPALPNNLFARDFDRIVCDGPEQHIIAHFKRDVKYGEPTDPEALFWYQPRVLPGTPASEVPGCARCGARWWLPGEHYHFKDGWR